MAQDAKQGVEKRMLAELDVVVFLKSNEDLDRVAERVFAALQSPYEPATSDEWGGAHYRATGLGFQATLFANSGEMLDPEFENYPIGLDISSQFWCVDLETVDLEGPLSEYYARLLAFELNVESATEILVETTEESEIFEIRAYRRNPQFRLDQAPTVPRVYVIESRQVEEVFGEDEEWDEEEDVAAEDEGDEEEIEPDEPEGRPS
jgi:hypothetical protein